LIFGLVFGFNALGSLLDFFLIDVMIGSDIFGFKGQCVD